MKKIYILFILLFNFIGFAQEQTMYWIGGAGDWSDISHWSFESGTPGITRPSSIPTPETNVIFNAASGITSSYTISINIPVTIKSLTFSDNLTQANSPNFVSNNNNLNVIGNVYLQPYIRFNFEEEAHNSSKARLVMNPNLNEVSTLTMNDIANNGYLPNFVKAGLGTTNIIGFTKFSSLYVTEGILNYNETVYNGSNYHVISGNGIFNLLNVIDLNLKRIEIQNDGVINLPLVQNIQIEEYFKQFSTSLINLPLLNTFNFDTLEINSDGRLTINPNSTLNFFSMNILGEFNFGQSVFNVIKTPISVYDSQIKLKNVAPINKLNVLLPSTDKVVLGVNLPSDIPIINELSFESASGDFINDYIVNKIKFAPSATYTISQGVTLTITESVTDTTLDCEPLYRIQSNGNQNANLKNESLSNITLNYVLLLNINSNGTNSFIVNGINDLASCTGLFSFNEPASETLYWVGTAGNNLWDDKLNWSLSSGGPPNGCIPTELDNVIFDQNSLIPNQEILVNNNNAYFHDIRIENDAPIFKFIGNASMNCYGSWYMRSGINIEVDGVYFKSLNTDVNTPETITSNGSFFRKVYIETLGDIELNDDFQTQTQAQYDLYFTKGIFKTNGFNMDISGSFMSENVNTRSLYLFDSNIKVNNTWQYMFGNKILDAGTSHIYIKNGRLYTSDAVYYNVTAGDSTNQIEGAFTLYGNNITINNLTVYRSILNTIGSGYNANMVRVIPPTSRAIVEIPSFTSNTFEIKPGGILSVQNNNTFTVNDQFIFDTSDCSALGEVFVIGKNPNQKFIFKSLNSDIYIPNVIMTGVEADLSTGKTYTTSGIQDADVVNWLTSEASSDNLYWIGVADNNWENPLNWTTNSDGTPSGGCVPTRFDNVFINQHSIDSDGNVFIYLNNQETSLNNFIADQSIPNVEIRRAAGLNNANLFMYGTTLTFGKGMEINAAVHVFNPDVVNINSNDIASNVNDLIFHNPSDNHIVNVYKNIRINNALTLNGGVVNFIDSEIVLGGYCTIYGIFNFPNKLSGQRLFFYNGEFNAQGKIIEMTSIEILNNTESSTINLQDSDITAWSFSMNNPNAILDATNSRIKFGGFSSVGNYNYNVIEGINGFSNYTIEGDSNFNEIILNDGRTITGNNIVGRLILKPRVNTLTLNENTTQTITDELVISGTPCYYNTITGLGVNGASIAYANPNNFNTYDFVTINGVNATEAPLIFGVNSNVGTNNTNIIKLTGDFGVEGLGENRTCETSRYIVANGYYGDENTTYTWFKKINGQWEELLGLPSNAMEIDVRNFGYDGEYKVIVIYNPNEPGYRCERSDELVITFTPELVDLPNLINYCEDEIVTLADIQLTTADIQFMTATGAVLEWYDAPTGGDLLPPTTVLTTKPYYAVFKATNGCYSASRTDVSVVFNEYPVANAGPDQIVTNQTLFTMQANNPAVGVGTWSVVSGDVSITDVNSYNTTVTLLSGESATLRWTVDNNGCTSSDTVIIGKFMKGNKVPRVNPSLRSRVF